MSESLHLSEALKGLFSAPEAYWFVTYPAAVAGLADADLEKDLAPVGMKGYAYIQGHLAHNSNHLNEIVSIRHMQGLWLEKT